MKYAICNETFQNWDWAATCQKVAELGYDGLEIAPFTLADDIRHLSAHARNVLRHTAQRAGLDIVGLHWLLVSPKGLSLTTDDPTVRAETAQFLIALAEFCADLQGRILVLGSPAQRRIPENATRETAVERLRACLEHLLPRCETLGLTLCLEPLPSPESNFILTLEEAAQIIRQIGHPALKTIFDVKSASSEGRPLSELISQYAPWIAHVHANDANRRGPGFGDTDFVPILHALQKADYAGYISIEVFDYSPDPITIARDGLDYLRRCQRNAAEIS